MKAWILTIALILSFCGCSKHPEIKRLITEDGYEVRILGQSFWEYQESYFYEVWREKKKIVDLTYFEAADGSKCFIRDTEDKKSILILVEGSEEILAKIER